MIHAASVALASIGHASATDTASTATPATASAPARRSARGRHDAGGADRLRGAGRPLPRRGRGNPTDSGVAPQRPRRSPARRRTGRHRFASRRALRRSARSAGCAGARPSRHAVMTSGGQRGQAHRGRQHRQRPHRRAPATRPGRHPPARARRRRAAPRPTARRTTSARHRRRTLRSNERSWSWTVTRALLPILQPV